MTTFRDAPLDKWSLLEVRILKTLDSNGLYRRVWLGDSDNEYVIAFPELKEAEVPEKGSFLICILGMKKEVTIGPFMFTVFLVRSFQAAGTRKLPGDYPSEEFMSEWMKRATVALRIGAFDEGGNTHVILSEEDKPYCLWQQGQMLLHFCDPEGKNRCIIDFSNSVQLEHTIHILQALLLMDGVECDFDGKVLQSAYICGNAVMLK